MRPPLVPARSTLATFNRRMALVTDPGTAPLTRTRYRPWRWGLPSTKTVGRAPKFVVALLASTYVSASTTAAGGQVGGGPATQTPAAHASFTVQMFPSALQGAVGKPTT